jgi:hypothetical protein
MTTGAVRAVVIAVCVIGIAGMIVGSIADNNAVAMTFGLMAAVAALCLIVATAVARSLAAPAASPASADAAGEEVESRVAALVAGGAEEREVRALVRAAVSLGRETAQTGR